MSSDAAPAPVDDPQWADAVEHGRCPLCYESLHELTAAQAIFTSSWTSPCRGWCPACHSVAGHHDGNGRSAYVVPAPWTPVGLGVTG